MANSPSADAWLPRFMSLLNKASNIWNLQTEEQIHRRVPDLSHALQFFKESTPEDGTPVLSKSENCGGSVYAFQGLIILTCILHPRWHGSHNQLEPWQPFQLLRLLLWWLLSGSIHSSRTAHASGGALWVWARLPRCSARNGGLRWICAILKGELLKLLRRPYSTLNLFKNKFERKKCEREVGEKCYLLPRTATSVHTPHLGGFLVHPLTSQTSHWNICPSYQQNQPKALVWTW